MATSLCRLTDRNGIVVTIKVGFGFDQDDLAERFRRAFRGSYAT